MRDFLYAFKKGSTQSFRTGLMATYTIFAGVKKRVVDFKGHVSSPP